MSRRPFPLISLFCLALVAGACTESFDSSAGCPLLCPSQQVSLREIILEEVDADLSVGTFPPLGQANHFTIAYSGDTLDAPVVVRFDSLVTQYSTLAGVVMVTAVDSAHVRITIDTLASRSSAPVTLEAYDVDTTAADDDFDAVLHLFRPDRLLGSRTFETSELKDTLSIPISNAILSAKIQQTTPRLRVGIRVRSSETVRLVMFTANEVRFPRLRYDPSITDETVNVVDVFPRSRTPADDPAVALAFTDYQLLVGGAFPLRRLTTGLDTAGVYQDSLIAVGGIARRRAYLRFNVPDSILNSSIVRATLIVHKKASSNYNLDDTLSLVTQAVLASERAPVSKALLLTDTLFFFPIAPLRMSPNQSGEHRIELLNYARIWTTQLRSEMPLAIAFRIGGEGRVMHEFLFYSSSGPVELRPRLRLTFIPRQRLGTP